MKQITFYVDFTSQKSLLRSPNFMTECFPFFKERPGNVVSSTFWKKVLDRYVSQSTIYKKKIILQY